MVRRAEDVMQVGDEVTVRILTIDEQGRIDLSLIAANGVPLEELNTSSDSDWEPDQREQREQREQGRSNYRENRPYRESRNNRDSRDNRDRRNNRYDQRDNSRDSRNRKSPRIPKGGFKNDNPYSTPNAYIAFGV